MNGKATCAILKQIRRDIAEKNNIALTIAECTHQGDCPGTCPRCEAEVRILEKALAEKKRKGLKTAVAGISAGLLAVGLSSCTPADKIGVRALIDKINDKFHPHAVEELNGDMAPPDWSPGGEGEDGETVMEELPDGIIEPVDEEEYELAGDVSAEDCPSEDAGENEWVEFAGIMPPEDLEPAVPDPAENDAP